MAEFFSRIRESWKAWRKRNKGKKRKRINSHADSINSLDNTKELGNEVEAANSQDHGGPGSSRKEFSVREILTNVSESKDISTYDEERDVNAAPIEEICEYASGTDIDSYREKGLTEIELRTIVCGVAEKVNMEYPSFYDFCIISSEEDYDSAYELKHLLCRAFDLTGCMVSDGFYRVGADIFSCFEFMMSRSTKVFFYLTENFNANQFYRRIQSGAVFQSLMSCAQANREKCVPIFPNGIPNYIPLPLSGIAGLFPQSKVQLRQSINTTYTLALRERRRGLDNMNREERRLAFHDQLQLSVRDYIQNKEQRHSAPENLKIENARPTIEGRSTAVMESSPSASGNKEPIADHTIANTLAALPIEDDARSYIMQLVSKSNPLPSSNVNVTGSSAVQVGNQITVNMTINPPMNYAANVGDDHEISDSDSFSENEQLPQIVD